MSDSIHHSPSCQCPYNQSTASQSNTDLSTSQKSFKEDTQQSMTTIPNKGMEFTPTSKGLTVPINTPPMKKILSQSEISQTETKVPDISLTESDVPIAPPRLRRKKSPLSAPITKVIDTPLDFSPISPRVSPSS